MELTNEEKGKEIYQKYGEDLISHCEEILGQFDNEYEHPIGEFFLSLSRYYDFEDGDDALNLAIVIYKIAFAFGYAIGQFAEPTNPKLLESIETIKEVIRERELLPYLPRERKKGGCHESNKNTRQKNQDAEKD